MIVHLKRSVLVNELEEIVVSFWPVKSLEKVLAVL